MHSEPQNLLQAGWTPARLFRLIRDKTAKRDESGRHQVAFVPCRFSSAPDGRAIKSTFLSTVSMPKFFATCSDLFRPPSRFWNAARELSIWGSVELLPYCIVPRRRQMNGLIYLVGLIVVIMFILSFLGLH